MGLGAVLTHVLLSTLTNVVSDTSLTTSISPFLLGRWEPTKGGTEDLKQSLRVVIQQHSQIAKCSRELHFSLPACVFGLYIHLCPHLWPFHFLIAQVGPLLPQ